MSHKTRDLLRLLEALLVKEGIFEFQRLATQWARLAGRPQREGIALVDNRWRTLLRLLRRREHYVVTVTTWKGVQLGLDGIADLKEDREIKECVPGYGRGGRAEAFVLMQEDNHVLFVAECERLGLVAKGVQRTQMGQAADALVQGIIGDGEAQHLLGQQATQLRLRDLKHIGESRVS